MNRSLFVFAISSAALSSMGNSSCGGTITVNSYFDLWCEPDGLTLCGWELERGAVRQAPTWHEDDLGAELVGDNVSISQSLADVPRDACLGVDLLTQQSEDANVVLELDFLDDGVIEYTAPVDGRDWKPIYFRVRTPEWFEGVRVRLKKIGGTRVILARAKIAVAEDCPDEPIELRNRPSLAPCEIDQQCGSTVCTSTASRRCLLGPGASGIRTQRCNSDDDCGGTPCGTGVCIAGTLMLGCFVDEDCGGLTSGCIAAPEEMLCQ